MTCMYVPVLSGPLSVLFIAFLYIMVRATLSPSRSRSDRIALSRSRVVGVLLS